MRFIPAVIDLRRLALEDMDTIFGEQAGSGEFAVSPVSILSGGVDGDRRMDLGTDTQIFAESVPQTSHCA